jgi:hypothetical protein
MFRNVILFLAISAMHIGFLLSAVLFIGGVVTHFSTLVPVVLFGLMAWIMWVQLYSMVYVHFFPRKDDQ